MHIKVIRHKQKKPEGLLEAVCMWDSVQPNEVMMVGDRYLTDIYGGNLLGMLTVVVDIFTEVNDNKGAIFGRRVEKVLLKLCSCMNDKPLYHPIASKYLESAVLSVCSTNPLTPQEGGNHGAIGMNPQTVPLHCLPTQRAGVLLLEPLSDARLAENVTTRQFDGFRQFIHAYGTSVAVESPHVHALSIHLRGELCDVCVPETRNTRNTAFCPTG